MSEYLGIEPVNFLLVFVVIVIASIPQSLMGIGFGMLAASILLLIDATLVPSTVIVMGTLVSAANALAHCGSIDRGELGVALLGRLAGIGFAILILGFVPDRDTFAVLTATVILFAVLLSIVDILPRKTTRTLLLAGTVSGITGTMTSVGAPPMGIVYQQSRRSETHATLNAYAAIGGFLSAIAIGWKGWLGLRDLWLALALLPGLAAGTWLAGYLRAYADRKFRPAVLAICAASAIAAIGKALV